MKYLLTLSAALLICLSSGTSFAQKKFAPQKSKINRTKQATYYWAGVLQKQGVTAYQYGTHVLKGESLSAELNEPETIFALKAGKKINLNKFVGKKVIITGKKVNGYPLELGPELIEVSAIELDKVVKINMN
ncbi:hypothetical protein [Pedobacter sp. WC2423]|uniref:hypothetical protein n=1 Tax=Pedobacter sp. WC2423 TaxID=3234142 RepID=UPI003466B823